MPNRNGMITVIHAAAKRLGLDRESYEAVLESVTGKKSCGDMSDSEIARVCGRMRELGFALLESEQQSLIRRLWSVMHREGIVINPSREALDAYCKRMVRYPLDRCSYWQCQKLIEDLKKWVRRQGTPDQIDAVLALCDCKRPFISPDPTEETETHAAV